MNAPDRKDVIASADAILATAKRIATEMNTTTQAVLQTIVFPYHQIRERWQTSVVNAAGLARIPEEPPTALYPFVDAVARELVAKENICRDTALQAVMRAGRELETSPLFVLAIAALQEKYGAEFENA